MVIFPGRQEGEFWGKRSLGLWQGFGFPVSSDFDDLGKKLLVCMYVCV